MSALFRGSLARKAVSKRSPLFRIAARGMAADAKTIKARMKVVTTIQKITKAMKMVAAAKLTGLQKGLNAVREFQAPLTDVWKSNEIKGPFQSRAIVLITSDKGLCGSLNNGLSRKLKPILLEANIAKKSNPPYQIYAIGGKGKGALERQYGRFFGFYINEYAKLKSLSFKVVAQIADRLLKEPIEEYVFHYNRFKNLISTEQKEERMYNFKLANAAAGPLRSKYDIESGGYSDIVRDLYEFRFAVRLWHMLSENSTCEMSARMNAMSNSSKAAGEMLNTLNMLYNRTRQAKITTELIEIVSGAAALDDG